MLFENSLVQIALTAQLKKKITVFWVIEDWVKFDDVGLVQEVLDFDLFY